MLNISQMKKTQVKTVKSNRDKRDIMTEMFEHFGIEVIDVAAQKIKLNTRRMYKK